MEFESEKTVYYAILHSKWFAIGIAFGVIGLLLGGFIFIVTRQTNSATAANVSPEPSVTILNQNQAADVLGAQSDATTQSDSPMPTMSPSVSPTVTPSPTPSPTPSSTPGPTINPGSTATPSPSPSTIASPTPTASPTTSSSPSSSASPTPTPS